MRFSVIAILVAAVSAKHIGRNGKECKCDIGTSISTDGGRDFCRYRDTYFYDNGYALGPCFGNLDNPLFPCQENGVLYYLKGSKVDATTPNYPNVSDEEILNCA